METYENLDTFYTKCVREHDRVFLHAGNLPIEFTGVTVGHRLLNTKVASCVLRR